MEAKCSKVLAKWRRWEDTVQAKALAVKADMSCCHEDTAGTITAALAMRLDTLASVVASWIHAEDCPYKIALREMQSYNKVDVAALKHLHKHRVKLAANAQWEDDKRQQALVKARHQEDAEHAKVLAAMANLGCCDDDAHCALVVDVRSTPLMEFCHKDASYVQALAKMQHLEDAAAPQHQENDKRAIERICPSGGSINRIRSRFGVGVRSFLWNWSV